MPTFQVHVVNSEFSASEDVNANDVATAQRQGLKAALAIGSDQVCDGLQFFAAVVCVECNGDEKARMVISIGQSPLK